MSLIIFLVFAALTALAIGGFVARRMLFEDNSYGRDPNVKAPAVWPGFVLAGVFALLAIFSTGIREVGVGQVGVVSNFGVVREVVLQSGVHYLAPFFNDVTILNTQVQVYEYKDIQGATRDLQAVTLSGTVNFRINPQTAWRLYKDVGSDYGAKVFTRPAETALKTVTPKFNATDIIAKRDAVAAEARTMLEAQVAPYGISVDAFYVSNIGLNQAFLDSVEQKQIAEQDVLRQKQVLEKSKVEAEQRVVEAKAAAEAQIAKAKGEAEANRLVAASLSDRILLNRYIEKLSDNISVMLVPAGQNTLLDLKSLLPKAE